MSAVVANCTSAETLKTGGTSVKSQCERANGAALIPVQECE
jgi:hypothetical protein